MKVIISGFIMSLMFAACSSSNNSIPPTIILSEFSGFEIKGKDDFGNVRIAGYEFRSAEGKTVVYNSCSDATGLKEAEIAEYELYRYRLLLSTCHALKKYLDAKPSAKSFFPDQLDVKLVSDLPATATPLLNKSQEEARTGKSVKTYFENGQLSLEKNGSVKLVTEDDEIFFTLLARGDLTNDGIEDLLVRVEWFARKASGKHVDILILSKTAKDKPATIGWRLKGCC